MVHECLMTTLIKAVKRFDLNPNLHLNHSINEYKCLKNPKHVSRVHMLLCLHDVYTLRVISPVEWRNLSQERHAGRPQGSILGPLDLLTDNQECWYTKVVWEDGTCCVGISFSAALFLSDTSRRQPVHDDGDGEGENSRKRNDEGQLHKYWPIIH